MIVANASAIVLSVLDDNIDARASVSRDRLRGSVIAAPAHWHIESTNAIRGLVMGQAITELEGDRALGVLARLHIAEHPTRDHWQRIWQLRHNFTAYDAAYIALAEHLAVPLVTAETGFVAAGIARCDILTVRRPTN